jgi:hypothetical protein
VTKGGENFHPLPFSFFIDIPTGPIGFVVGQLSWRQLWNSGVESFNRRTRKQRLQVYGQDNDASA